MRSLLASTLRFLWSYRLIRWAVYTYITLTIIDNVLLLFFEVDHLSQNSHEMEMRTFPHPDLPENQRQALREVLFVTHKLRSALEQVLLPEEGKDEDLVRYDQMTRSLETRGDMSWLVFQESDAAKFYNAIGNGREERRLVDGQMVKEFKLRTPDEQRLEEKYAVFKRLQSLHEHYSDLIYGKREHQDGDSADRGEFKQPNSWAPEFVQDRLPPFKPESDGATKSEAFVFTNPTDEEEAGELYDDLMRRRNRVIAYLQIHPPKPMGWAPKRSDAWEKTDQADVRSGNLHGLPEYWQPIYRSWGLEDVPFSWKERELTEEEQQNQNDAIMKKVDQSQERRASKKEYLASVTPGVEIEQAI